MSWFMVDVETDGPIPGKYSMIAIAAVIVEPLLDKTFFSNIRPISNNWLYDTIRICGVTREQTMEFEPAERVMQDFSSWVESTSVGRPIFISDNNGFDWMFTCWYLHMFTGRNPFGHSSTNLESLYKGMMKNMRLNFKHMRNTKHTHCPLDDAIGNAEAMNGMIQMGLQL